MNKIAYEDVKREIVIALDKSNLMERRMYWRGFVYSLSEYCELRTIDYLALNAIINRYGNEKKDFEVKGKLIY